MPIHAPFVRFWCHNGKTETFIALLFLQECNNRGLAYMNQTVYKSVLRFSVGVSGVSKIRLIKKQKTRE